MYYVYIVTCADTTLYIGSTNNVEKRVREHNSAKNGAHYTKIRRPVVLSYCETCDTYALARTREAQLKRFSRAEKLALLRTLSLG